MARKTGRPTEFEPATADEICLRLMDGESLRAICSRPAMPARRTVLYWLAGDWPKDDPRAGFLRQYARAREAQAEIHADDIIEIADGEDPEDDGGQFDRRARRRMDARKWIAAKLLPKRYADRLVHEGGEKPIRVEPTPLDNRELARRIALILSRADRKLVKGSKDE